MSDTTAEGILVSVEPMSVPEHVERVMAEAVICAHKLPESSVLRYELIEAVVSELGRQRRDMEGVEPYDMEARHVVHMLLDDPALAVAWMEQFS